MHVWYMCTCVQSTLEEVLGVLLYQFLPCYLETDILMEPGMQLASYKPPVFCAGVTDMLNHSSLLMWVLGI